jgi:hypothetical protein
MLVTAYKTAFIFLDNVTILLLLLSRDGLRLEILMAPNVTFAIRPVTEKLIKLLHASLCTLISCLVFIYHPV